MKPHKIIYTTFILIQKLRIYKTFFIVFILFACETKKEEKELQQVNLGSCFVNVLGTLQDGGSPHAGCIKDCCKDLFLKPNHQNMVTSLGLVDQVNKKYWLFEASPDFSRQIKILNKNFVFNHSEAPDGSFITHAHLGHYAGLMYLGKEAMNANGAEVFAMPRLKNFLETNGPWSQLVNLKNIHLNILKKDSVITLSNNFKMIPFVVPHRDEFSETVGYKIIGPNKSMLFIPDIDKWEKWDRSIIEEIKKVDVAFIDGTFYNAQEINNRNIKDIPHPFVIETIRLFKELPKTEKSKIHFIHFNHTNKFLLKGSEEYNKVLKAGFNVSEFNSRINL